MRKPAVTVAALLSFASALPLVAEWDPNQKCVGSKGGPPLIHTAFSGDGQDVWHELIATRFTRLFDLPTNRPTLDSYGRESVGPWAIDTNHREGGAFAQIAFAYVDYYFRNVQRASTVGRGIFPGAQCVDLSGAKITVEIKSADLKFGDKIDGTGAELRFWFQTSTQDMTPNSAPAPANPASVSPPNYGGPKLNYTYTREVVKLPKPGSGPVETTLTLSPDLNAWKCMGSNVKQLIYDAGIGQTVSRTNKVSPGSPGGYMCLSDSQPDFAKWLSAVYIDFGFLLFLPELDRSAEVSFDKWEQRYVHDRWPDGRIEFGAITLRKDNQP